MECMGDVDSSHRVVRLVAGMVEYEFDGHMLSVLKFEFSYPLLGMDEDK